MLKNLLIILFNVIKYDILSKSFGELNKTPKKWNEHTEKFFGQELDRLIINTTLRYDKVNEIGLERENKSKIQSDGNI